MNSNDYDKETTEKAEATVKRYLENNFTNIDTIEIEGVYRGEMGGMRAEGTVNNKYEFSMSINESAHTSNSINESDYTIGSMGRGKGFPDFKEECKNKICDY